MMMRGDSGKMVRPVALIFATMDANHDLIVDKAEMEAAMPAEFARADANKSGEADAFEMTEWGKAELGDADQTPNRTSFDVDLNGGVSLTEFRRGMEIEFAKLDLNSDGRIERSEMLVGRGMPMMEPGSGGGREGGFGAPGGGRGGRGGGGMPGGGGRPPG